MRFYLLYKNHGLYDPVLDDTEYIYVPIDPQELEINRECEENQRTETTLETGKNGTIKEPLNVPVLDDKIKSKANLHEALLKISAGDLPEAARFKLPISEEYDPEGKKVTKLQKLYAKNVEAIDLKTIAEKLKQDERTVAENLCDSNAYEPTLPTEFKSQSEDEMTKNESQYSKNEIKKEINLETLKQTASRIVGDSIDKALSLAKEIKQEIDVELEQTTQIQKNKSEIVKESLHLESESMQKEYDSCTKTVIDKRKDEETNKQEKEKLNVAEEIKKYETLKAPMDSKVNLEERKQLAKQDIEETIEEGTVRRRSEIFAKEMNISKTISKRNDVSSDTIFKSLDKYKKIPMSNEKPQIHETDGNIISNTKETEHKAFTLGAQTVPRLRQALLSSYNSNLLLKTFFLQLTKVMVALSKILTLEQTLSETKKINEIEKNIVNIKQETKAETEEDKLENVEHSEKYYSDVYNSSDANFEADIIKKEKLSGAKIAQIEGNKPPELTDKMDIVISELLGKAILEDHNDNGDFFRRSSQSSCISNSKENRKESSNSTNAQHDHFFDQRSKHFDRRKLFEILEEKTKTMEIKEMISEKHTTEYKSTKTKKQNGNIIYYIALVEARHFPYFEEIKKTKNLYEHEIKTEMKNDENLVYVAIVEAHANINEEAISKELMRRQLQSQILQDTSIKQNVDIEDTKTIEIHEINTQIPSLANTSIIEPKVLITATPMSHKPLKFARSATDMEQISKKIAVQNIVHAIEPLLRHESQKTYNKQALSVIEMPTKAIAETTDIKVEEQQTFLKAEVSVKQRSFMAIEQPEPVVEITEITTEEDENIPVEFFKPIVSEPHPVIEMVGKSVAEVSEIQTDEANMEVFSAAKIINKRPSIILEKPTLSVAETITATAEYTSDDIILPEVISQQAKINVEAKVAAEVTEVSTIEKEHDTLKTEKILHKQSEILHEDSALMVAETVKIVASEPKDEVLEISKTINQQANVEFQKLIATNVSVVHPEETYTENLKVTEVNEKLTQITSERPILPVAETLTISPQEPRDETLTIPHIISKQSEPVIETPILTVPECITIATEGPIENTFSLPKLEKQLPNIDIKELKALISNIVIPEEPKQEIIQIPETSTKLAQMMTEKCSLEAAVTLAIFLGGPMDGKINIPSIVAEYAKVLIEKPKLTVAEVLKQLLEEPKEDLKLPKVTPERARVIIQEFTSLIKTLIVPVDQCKVLEVQKVEREMATFCIEKYLSFMASLNVPLDNYTDLKLLKSQFQMPEVGMESIFLTLASCLTVLLGGPKEDIYETPIVNTYQAKVVMEILNLFVPEAVITFLEGPRESYFDIPKIIKEECKVLINQHLSLVNSIMIPVDQYNILEVPKINAAIPLVVLENTFMPVAIVLTMLMCGPCFENFEIVKATTDRAKIVIAQLEAVITSYVHLQEPKEKEIEIPVIVVKNPQVTIENCLFAPKCLIIETDGPKEDNVKITQPKCEKSSASINKFRAIEVLTILLSECVIEDLKVLQIIKKKPQMSIEDVNLHIANVLTIYSEEPKDKLFDVDTKAKHEARVKIEELKAAQVKFMPVEEPEPEEMIASELNKKQIQASVQSSSLTVAQTSAILPIEQKEEFLNTAQTVSKTISSSVVDTNLISAQTSVVQIEESAKTGLDLSMNKSLKAHVEIEGHKALQTSITNIVEPNSEIFEISSSETKHTKALIEKPMKTSAVVTTINTSEFGSDIKSIEKTNAYKHAKLQFESSASVAQQNIITAMEETHDVSHERSVMSKSAKSSIVESSITAMAEVIEKDTEVNVLMEKPKTRSTKIENIEIEANLKIPTPSIIDNSVNEVSAEYSIKVPQKENVYAEYGFGERKIDVDVVSEIYESIRLMKKRAFQKQSMEASLSLAKELQTRIEMAEIEALQEEFIRSGSISSSSSMASSPLTPILEEYFFNIKAPSLMSRYRRFRDVFEEASLKLKSKVQTSTIQNLDASLTLILQDLAMAQLESETNDIEVIEIDDYEDVRQLHFSTALMAISQNQSLASFSSSEAQSLKAIHAASAAQSSYGYSMSVEDADLKEHITRKSAKAVKFADTAQYMESDKIHTLEIAEMDMDTKIQSSGEVKVQAASSKKKSKVTSTLDVSSVSAESRAIESSLVKGTTMETSALEARSVEGHSMRMSSTKVSTATKNRANLEHLDIQAQEDIQSSSEIFSESHKKLSIKTDIERKEGIDVKSPSPPTLPPTPLTDEYIFRLQTKMPEPSEYIPRDCSLSPEGVEKDIILKGGLIPHIRTTIERILYSPPFITPPTSPDHTVPVYSKSGGKSGIFKFLS